MFPKFRANTTVDSPTEAMIMIGLWLFFVFGPSMIVGALTWPWAINITLGFFGKAATAHWYHGMLIGIIPTAGWWGILAVLIVFIISFFV